MATWTPDSTFYPSPRMAVQAPPESLAYVALLNVSGDGGPDRMAVVDTDSESSSHGRARVGMRVTFFDLTLWSFLMASAHGAGLMIVPALLGLPAAAALAEGSLQLHMTDGLDESFAIALAAVIVHTLAMLVAAGAIAVVVYDRVALAILRRGSTSISCGRWP